MCGIKRKKIIQTSFVLLFLVADTQLYNRLRPSVLWSINPLKMIESKRGKTNVLDTFSVHLYVGVWIRVGRPCPPVRFCDPVSLDSFIHDFSSTLSGKLGDGRIWQILAEIGRSWQKLAEFDRILQNLVEFDRNW